MCSATGPRSILLIPIPVFAEAILRISEGTMVAGQLGDILARESGVLAVEALPEQLADTGADREAAPTSAA